MYWFIIYNTLEMFVWKMDGWIHLLIYTEWVRCCLCFMQKYACKHNVLEWTKCGWFQAWTISPSYWISHEMKLFVCFLHSTTISFLFFLTQHWPSYCSINFYLQSTCVKNIFLKSVFPVWCHYFWSGQDIGNCPQYT